MIEVAEDTELKDGLSNDFLKEDAWNFFTDDDLIQVGNRQIHFMYTVWSLSEQKKCCLKRKEEKGKQWRERKRRRNRKEKEEEQEVKAENTVITINITAWIRLVISKVEDDLLLHLGAPI